MKTPIEKCRYCDKDNDGSHQGNCPLNYREYKRLESDCARFKALLADAWKFAKPNSFDDPMDKFEEYRKLGARIKREGIG